MTVRLAIPFLLLIALHRPAPLRAQAGQLPPLSFLGFEPGAPLSAVVRQVQSLGGKELRCIRSKRDITVRDCRASVVDPGSRRVVDLWVSMIDSSAGVLMLSSPLSGVELDTWRSGLESAFGSVGANVQGPQWMLQWVRQGRMLRLTWRIENGKKVASVSLIDGRVLDSWGRRKASGGTPQRASGER
jgi:hypothetical protein